MQSQEKDKLPSHLEVSSAGKIKGINAGSSTLHEDMLEITSAVCSRSGKVLNETISNNDDKQEKHGDDST